MSEFTSLSDIVTIFYNSAQPNFVRYHIITLYFALVAPKQSIVIQLSFATTIACTLLWLPQSKVRFYPTFVRYHHRLLSCSGCPKAKYGSIRLLFATTIACCLALVAPKQSAVQSSYLLLLNGSQRLCVFTQRHYFLLTEFQPTCCRARSSRSWAISIFRKQCSSRPI